ncbi:MAG TPA: glycosyltransferase family 4 protein [bacterium]|nr:glycosyltransferase family 4 protein [bacterium]
MNSKENNKKIKVLVLTKTLDERCGWGRYSWNIVSRLIKRADIQVLCLVEATSQKGKYEEQFFSVRYRPGSFLRMLLNLRKKIKTADVVHCFEGYPYAIFFFLAALGLRRKKLFINGIGTYTVKPLSHPLKKILLSAVYRRASKIFCISSYTASRLSFYLPELKNIEVVHMGNDFRATDNLSDGKTSNQSPVIISVGAIKARKGQLDSVQAVKLLLPRYPDLQLNIVGDINSQNYYQHITSFIKENNLNANVHFYQQLTDQELQEHYAKADIFLMPSTSRGENFEGFGLVYLEAAVFGVPSIGCLETGAIDAIKDGESGYLVPQDSPAEIASAVVKIFEGDYQKMSAAAVAWSQNFDWDKTVARYYESYLL